MLLYILTLEAWLSKEQLIDSMVKASEEKHGLLAQLRCAKKVWNFFRDVMYLCAYMYTAVQIWLQGHT